jgi:inner membrane protein
MASPLTHAVVGATLGAIHHLPPRAAGVWWLVIICTVMPDLDALGFWLGVPYESFWGHRGFTHSIAFAVLLSGIFAWWISDSTAISRTRLWGLYCVATLSHGVLDALTDGGLGVAFFSPVDQSRYFFPVRPIHVSSMSLGDVLGSHGLEVIVNEIQWVWIPCGLVGAIVWWWNGRRPD